MIDIRKLKELVRLMVENDLTELDLRDSEEQVTVRRPNASSASHAYGTAPAAPSAAMAAAPRSVDSAETPGPVAAGEEPSEDLLRIESPMVGTFYAAANPDSPPFVTAGSIITPDKVVCVIEAMKIFNEIKAECAGVIQKVLVKNGDPVEFGQPLFLVKPA